MKRNSIIISLLLITITASYATPRNKYRSPEIASKLDIPWRMENWISKNAASQINLTDQRFNFISDIFARIYLNKYGENLLFFVLDAGNFHNPKVCFGGSGFQNKELPQTELTANGRIIKANTVYFDKPGENYVVIYWICINKKQVDWTKQKLIQLWYSLFNKQKIGLMVRIDIPTASEEKIPDSVKLAQDFIKELGAKVPTEQANLIFGSK